ncbi:hypothetical protein ElyMa_006034700 [Elysia marginata]|uniref:IgGFc-binding protein N-terminal domain-containing protein n=1 Tax=Elysia marginata TaxID=1093978 RepID=A0AAV4GJL5_9GAST|nr:hypothetical protein ElyMa_006034700 [Elysia marginata]
MFWRQIEAFKATRGTVICLGLVALANFTSGLDTCGTHFFVPTFPACNLFLEVVPCFNLTPSVLVAMTTVQGREIYNFTVTYGGVKEITLQDHNKNLDEGLIMRSNAPLSLYVHQTLGDSMVVFPVETYAMAYHVPRMSRVGSDVDSNSDDSNSASGSTSSSSSGSSSSSSSSSSATNSDSDTSRSAELKSNKTQALLQSSLNAALYIFSPHSINITILSSLDDSSWETASSLLSPTTISSSTTTISPPSKTSQSSSSASSSQSSSSASSSPQLSSSSQSLIKLEAFAIYKYPINSSLLYRLYSDGEFAVVIVQSPGALHQSHVICKGAPLHLLDFVPPFATTGRVFYLAFYDSLQFLLYISGRENTTLDIITDSESQLIRLDQSGSSSHHVTSTTAVWMSASLPVTVYTRLVICNDTAWVNPNASDSNPGISSSSPLSTFSPTIPSQSSTSSSSSSSPSSLSSSSANPVCAGNGFFLSSIENFFTCDGKNTTSSSGPACHCRCPSVFQRDLDPLTFLTGQRVNVSASGASSDQLSAQFSTWTRPSSSVYPLLVGELYDVNTAIARAVDFSGAYDIIVNTNTSFLVFRQDFMNLNFLPAGISFKSSACKDFISRDLSPHLDTHSRFLDAACSDSSAESTVSGQNDSSCMCELMQDLSVFFSSDGGIVTSYNSGKSSSVVLKTSQGEGQVHGGQIFYWEEDKEDTTRPLIAVVVSLCVAIFAVIALISGYMLAEMVSRRKHVRNTKIRPFVS